MAEFVQQKLEDMRPILEQMEKLKLFNDKEIRVITKKWKEHEYKLQRQHKSIEDFIHYIQYQMHLMKLIKQRREKTRVTKQKSDIDFAIAKKINGLYKQAIARYQNDTRLWLAYISFCKKVDFNSEIKKILGRMLSVQQTKEKIWHIAARWHIEEQNDSETAKLLLYRGLLFHPDSQLIYTDLIRIELDEVLVKNRKSDLEKEYDSLNEENSSGIPSELQSIFILYKQARIKIKDIKFFVNLLNISQKYEDVEALQNEILKDIIKDYPHEPLMWDTMAKRELEGLVSFLNKEETSMEVDSLVSSPSRIRLKNCYDVYHTAVKKLQSKEIWSLFIDCMIEINQDLSTLPNFKRKLLRNALLHGHQANKLQEKYYLYWIDMLDVNQGESDDKPNEKLYEVLCWATEALPESESLWKAKLNYLYKTNQDNLALKTFKKGVENLGENSLSLWKLRLFYLEIKHAEKLEEFFQEALKSDNHKIINFIQPIYIEWIIINNDIDTARKEYDKLRLLSPCLALHNKMINIEISQDEISSQNIRNIYELMTLQFGRKNVDVWLEYAVFEMKYGDTGKASSIYHRAIKTLKPSLVDTFTSKFSIMKTNPALIKNLD